MCLQAAVDDVAEWILTEFAPLSFQAAKQNTEKPPNA